MYLNCGCFIKYYVIVCAGFSKKYAGLNVGIIIKQKMYFKKIVY